MSDRHLLPTNRRSLCHKFAIAGHEGYIHLGFYDDGRVGEIFVRIDKEGSTVAGLMDTIATLASVALQHGANVNSFIEKFTNERFEPSGPTGNPTIPEATSLTDYVFRFLAQHDFLSEAGTFYGSPTRGNLSGPFPV